MGVIQDPLKYIIPIFITLMILLLLFRFNNWVDDRKIKEKKPKAEPVKKVEEKVETESNKITEIKEEAKNEIIVADTNYLYDRFVVSPTKDDEEESKEINSAFLSNEEADKIRNRKTEIKVGEVHLSEKEQLYNKIEAMKSENLALKEHILSEFNTLSKEMKLMLLENIISNME